MIYTRTIYTKLKIGFLMKIKKTEFRKYAFERKIKNTYDIEIQNGMICIHEKNLN